jgi:phosphotriesterase-related protein
MMAKVVTVRGEIDPQSMGVVLPHEHLLWDLRCWAHELPAELAERQRMAEPVRLENRGHVVYHPFHYLDNLRQTDAGIAAEEATRFKLAGGGTICDVTPSMLGRDPAALRRISLATGLHIVMGSAFYVAGSWSEAEKKLGAQEIRDLLVREFREGAAGGHGGSAVKPGILGEVGVSDIDNPLERRSLAASGMAQKELGCPVSIHTPIWGKTGNAILDILEGAGADLEKVALCHLDPTMDDRDYADSLAKRGAYIEFDLFDTHIMSFEGVFLPSDNDRIAAILDQVERGNLERILLSHDNCMKIKLTRWGGHGYAHILENIVPRLLAAGLTAEQVRTILVENPKRHLSW